MKRTFLAITASAVIALPLAALAQTNATPTPPAAPAVQATKISQIPGAKITKTGEVITGIDIKDCTVLTDADYKLIRQTETLKSLGFAHGPNDASLKILEGMPNIESFSSNGTLMSDAGAAVLASFKNLHALTFFHPGKEFTGTGLTALTALPIENLTVAGSLAFADPGMAAVGQLPHIKQFRTWHSGVTVEGLKSLGSLKELKYVMIGQRLANKPPSTIDDAGVAVLATFSSLDAITINETRLSLPALSKLSQIPNLKSLVLGEIDIPEADIATLKQQLPKTDIKWTPPSEGSKKRIDGIFGSTVAAATAPPPVPAKK